MTHTNWWSTATVLYPSWPTPTDDLQLLSCAPHDPHQLMIYNYCPVPLMTHTNWWSTTTVLCPSWPTPTDDLQLLSCAPHDPHQLMIYNYCPVPLMTHTNWWSTTTVLCPSWPTPTDHSPCRGWRGSEQPGPWSQSPVTSAAYTTCTPSKRSGITPVNLVMSSFKQPKLLHFKSTWEEQGREAVCFLD